MTDDTLWWRHHLQAKGYTMLLVGYAVNAVHGLASLFFCRPGIVTGDTLWRRHHLRAKGYTVLPIRATEYMDIADKRARVRCGILEGTDVPCSPYGCERLCLHFWAHWIGQGLPGIVAVVLSIPHFFPHMLMTS